MLLWLMRVLLRRRFGVIAVQHVQLLPAPSHRSHRILPICPATQQTACPCVLLLQGAIEKADLVAIAKVLHS